ncbi:MAG: hypothetical protein KAH95_15985 [Spirochaetales bacterium]|nr:hypothetical protein [Spirochaetales bacterium]
MEIEINHRGNGACPLCTKNGKCKITRALSEATKHIKQSDTLEIVIYTCPEFEETA